MKYLRGIFCLLGLLVLLVLSGCVTRPPKNVENLCDVFKQYPKWYRDAHDVERRWRVPVPVQMAMIHQESKFNAKAKPGRTKLLWIIPWTRPSSAYGYAQALDGTWSHYKRTNGGLFSSRDSFGDGVDFIGWYANMAHVKAGIRRDDAYNLYLAYHEGVGGYQRKTYFKKKWLLAVARKVESRAQMYRAQLAHCGKSFKSWYKF